MDNLATFMTRPVSTIGISDDERVLITAWYVQHATAYAQRLQTNTPSFLEMEPQQHVGEFFEFFEKPCFVTCLREIAVPEEYLNFFAFKSPKELDAYPCMSADTIQTETVDEPGDQFYNARASATAPSVFDNGLIFEYDENGDIVEPALLDS
jgi:hypothetical protein